MLLEELANLFLRIAELRKHAVRSQIPIHESRMKRRVPPCRKGVRFGDGRHPRCLLSRLCIELRQHPLRMLLKPAVELRDCYKLKVRERLVL